MSRFHGQQDRQDGRPRHKVREQKRREAEARNAKSHPDDRRITREGDPATRKAAGR